MPVLPSRLITETPFFLSVNLDVLVERYQGPLLGELIDWLP